MLDQLDLHFGTADSLSYLVFGDAGIGAQDVAEHAGGNCGGRVTEIVVSPSADVGHPGERAATPALTVQWLDLIAEVIPDERKRSIGESGSQRSRGWRIAGHRCPVFVYTLKDDFVFADV